MTKELALINVCFTAVFLCSIVLILSDIQFYKTTKSADISEWVKRTTLSDIRIRSIVLSILIAIATATLIVIDLVETGYL
jgi:hypothetical protein